MNDNSLDEIFKNKLSKPETVHEGNWDVFQVQLAKKMFYKFTWTHFNAYYLGALITVGVSASAIILFSVFSSPKAPQKSTTNPTISVSKSLLKSESFCNCSFSLS